MRTAMIRFAALILTLGLPACVKSVPPEPLPPNAITNDSGDVERVIVDTVIEIPSKFKKVSRDLEVLIWDVKNEKGAVVALGLMDAEKFPVKVKIKAKDLLHPLDPKSPLTVSARLVKLGDENKPPKKGQLVGFMGAASVQIGEPVVPQGVKKHVLAKAERKLGLSSKLKPVSVGDLAKITLEPYQF